MPVQALCPFSKLVTDSKSACGCSGTLLTARLALMHGLACNTAGGTHHAFPDAGSGFCILNDLAVTAAVLLGEGRVGRVLILDLDVHQASGNRPLTTPSPATTPRKTKSSLRPTATCACVKMDADGWKTVWRATLGSTVWRNLGRKFRCILSCMPAGESQIGSGSSFWRVLCITCPEALILGQKHLKSKDQHQFF